MSLLVHGGALDRVERTVVLIARANGHIVETVVRDDSHTNLDVAYRHVHLRLASVVVILVYHALRHGLVCCRCTVLFHAGCRLDRFFGANTVAVAGLLKLLRLLQVAELVMRNEEIASTI